MCACSNMGHRFLLPGQMLFIQSRVSTPLRLLSLPVASSPALQRPFDAHLLRTVVVLG